mmetsp:Transcript_33788/g.78497  ORF Transcript_33788/g.78497 Transcript_33788/m.78497 type:complete len:802 (+) Transcript_33788:2858-5263(+)
MEVADVDQRTGVRQLRFFQEVLDRGRVVHLRLSAHTLDLLHVADAARGLNVLEVHIWVGAGVQNRTEEIENAFIGAERLEHLHNLHCTNLLVVLDGHLHSHLQILAVVPHEIRQALQRSFGGEPGEVLNQELWRHLVRMHHDTLEVRRVGVVLHGPLHESCLFTKLTDVSPVVVSEHVHLEDGLCHFGCLLQVHGQELSLKAALLRLVRLEGIQHDRRRLLQTVLVHEDLDDLVDVNERYAILPLQKTLRKVGRTLRVGRNHVLQKLGVVCLIADSLDIGDDLVYLPKLNEALDDLLVDVGTEVDGKRKLCLDRTHDVSEFLRALELVFLEPLLDELLSALLHDRPHELHGFKAVQLVVLQQRGEIMQDGRRLPRRSLHAFELLNGLWSAQESTLALGRDEGCTFVVAGSKKLIELALEELICARQTKTPRQCEGNVLTIWNLNQLVHDVVHDGSLVDLGGHHSSPLVHEDDATGEGRANSDKDGLLGHPRSHQHGSSADVKHEQEAGLGNHEDHPVLLAEVKSHREVRWCLWRHGNLHLHLERGGALPSVLQDVHDVQLRLRVTGLPLLEGEDSAAHTAIVHVDVAEGACMPLQQLLLLPFHTVQLHVAVDRPPRILRGDACQQAPRHLAVRRIVDDLRSCFSQLPSPLEDLLRLAVCHGEVPVIDVLGTDEGQEPGCQPTPKHDLLGALVDSELLLGVEVEDLHKMSCLAFRRSLQGDNVVSRVHQGGLSLHRALVHSVVVVHVHDDHLCRAICSGVLDANVLIRLHRQAVELEGLSIDALACQVDRSRHSDGQLRHDG